MRKIYFSNEECPYTLRHKRRYAAWLAEVTRKEGFELEQVRIVLCNDLYLLKINQNFLNHDSLTDIITFQYNEIDKGLSGELYISMERVKENARNYGVKTKNELARVMVHGFYHLCGYKDKIRKEKELMRAKENSALEFLHESFNL